MVDSKKATELVELLRHNRDAVSRVLAADLPDVTHRTLHWHLAPDELEAIAAVGTETDRARQQLFQAGVAHGLTPRDIVAALLRPVAMRVRPTLVANGCQCRTCSRKT
ncbi:MAG: hypothetical protein O3B84_01180 [Chloroflexi bacterium]|nr:hypothetical protein [Chloroflexota bacterium]